MIEIEKFCNDSLCDSCVLNKNTVKVVIDAAWVYLCDDCLQELNRKIVEHLAEKNIQEGVKMNIQELIEKLKEIQNIYGNDINVFNIVSGQEVREVEIEVDGYIYIK